MINSTHSISRDATLSSARQINLISNLESRAGADPMGAVQTGGMAIIKKFPRVFRTRIWCGARSNALARFLSARLVQSVIVAVSNWQKDHSSDRRRKMYFHTCA
jgi:hypothetical protein